MKPFKLHQYYTQTLPSCFWVTAICDFIYAVYLYTLSYILNKIETIHLYTNILHPVTTKLFLTHYDIYTVLKFRESQDGAHELSTILDIVNNYI